MTNTLSTKRALLISTMALILCFTMLLGTTFAWFTDSVTSTGNKIQAGTLKIDLALYNTETSAFESIKENKAPIFDYDLWEPGYTDVKLLKVENLGTLALKWKATIVGVDVNSILADVIDVYVLPIDASTNPDDAAAIAALPADRTLAGFTPAGTLAEFVAGVETTTVGKLNPKDAEGDTAYLCIALKMREEANNDYQGLSLGSFDVQILATQINYESDSIDENYDENAEFELYRDATTGALIATTKEALSTAAALASNDDTIQSVTLRTDDGEKTVPVARDTQAAKDALAGGADTVILPAGSYTFPASSLSEGDTIICDENTVFTGVSGLDIDGATIVGATFDAAGNTNGNTGAGSGSIDGTFTNCTFTGNHALRYCYAAAGDTVVFENCVFDGDTRGIHFDGGTGEVFFKNCTIYGFNALGSDLTMATFEGCTFGNGRTAYNGLNLYCNTKLINCTFEFNSGKTNFIDMEGTGKTLTITNCTATLDGADAIVSDFVGGSQLANNTVEYN